MFTCPKCGQKLKTLHERVYGEKPHYVPSGYHCETCKIYYNAKTNQKSKVENLTIKNAVGGQTAIEQNRIRPLHKPHANAAQNECVENSLSSSSNLMRDSGWGEIRTLDHLCVRQVS